MNEKLQYAEMLEIPSECNIKYKPAKKRRILKKKNEKIKEQVIEKVNEENSLQETEDVQPEIKEESREEENSTVTIKKAKTKKKFKFSIITAELVIIAVLIGGILLTDALMPNGGINTYVSSIIGGENQQTSDTRVFSDFNASIPTQSVSNITLKDGIMSLIQNGSVYSPCDGTVKNIVKNQDGTYKVEIYHNDNFKTVFSSLTYLYFSKGEKVFSTIPVGYGKAEETTVCFYDKDDSIITSYTLSEDKVVWEI